MDGGCVFFHTRGKIIGPHLIYPILSREPVQRLNTTAFLTSENHNMSILGRKSDPCKIPLIFIEMYKKETGAKS